MKTRKLMLLFTIACLLGARSAPLAQGSETPPNAGLPVVVPGGVHQIVPGVGPRVTPPRASDDVASVPLIYVVSARDAGLTVVRGDLGVAVVEALVSGAPVFEGSGEVAWISWISVSGERITVRYERREGQSYPSFMEHFASLVRIEMRVNPPAYTASSGPRSSIWASFGALVLEMGSSTTAGELEVVLGELLAPDYQTSGPAVQGNSMSVSWYCDHDNDPSTDPVLVTAEVEVEGKSERLIRNAAKELRRLVDAMMVLFPPI